MQNDSQSLDLTLNSLPQPPKWPMALPPAHLTVARWFNAIVDQGELTPRMCQVLKKNLLYFFYGGVFYRTGNKPTRNAAELPIAFLFDPSVLTSFSRYYPFDTGALARGLYGEAGKQLVPFEYMFEVSGRDASAPSRMVYHLYRTNDRYLRGQVNDELSRLPSPLPQLSSFFSEDLSALEIDQRQFIIECQSEAALSLAKGLLWVGFPDSMTDVFIRLYALTEPSMPEYYPYQSHIVFNPGEIAAKLEASAAEVVKRFVNLPQAKGI